MIEPRQLFEIWSPSSSIWSVWSKPVLFAQMDPAQPTADDSLLAINVDLSWLATLDTNRTAIIVNLPDITSVAVGLKLVQYGYQPIPLFNCSVGPGEVIP